MNQLSLANGFERSTKRTRRPAFLGEMLAVVPWDALVARIAPHAPSGATDRPPFPVLVMPRVHFLQQWFALSDEVVEDALHDIQVYRAFAGIDPGTIGIPDATTILRFRHLLERHDLAIAFLQEVNALLEARGQVVRPGTQVDAKLARSQSSTTNRTGMRPPSGTRPGRGTRGSSA
jgi:IS5 family transposase